MPGKRCRAVSSANTEGAPRGSSSSSSLLRFEYVRTVRKPQTPASANAISNTDRGYLSKKREIVSVLTRYRCM